MKVNMFVFLGISDSTTPEYSELFLEKLKSDLQRDNVSFSYTLNNNLLTLTIENFRYYVGFTNNKTELKDWLQMAKDFELDSDKKLSHLDSIVNPGIIKKYIGFSDRDKRYAAIAPYIIKRMKEIDGIDIYSFY
jgi:hypothetical protein